MSFNFVFLITKIPLVILPVQLPKKKTQRRNFFRTKNFFVRRSFQCLSTKQFAHNGAQYEQVFDTAAPTFNLSWKRYADDVILAVSGKWSGTTYKLRRLPVERESDRRLSFLDLKVYSYCNATHTVEYLSFNSHHPIWHKKSITKGLFTRADYLPPTCGCMADWAKICSGILKVDGYPQTFLRNCLKSISLSHRRSTTVTLETINSFTA